MKILILISLFWSFTSFAETAVKEYHCTIRLFAAGLPDNYAEQAFTAPVVGGSHGGESFDFTFGEYAVSVLANGRWLGINWARNGVLIAQSLLARASENQDSSVLMSYNPLNLEEYASLDCDAQF